MKPCTSTTPMSSSPTMEQDIRELALESGAVFREILDLREASPVVRLTGGTPNNQSAD